MVTGSSSDLVEDDAIEDHGQFGGSYFDAWRPVALSSGEGEDTSFEPLIPQGPAVLFPGEDLESVTASIFEDEPVSGEGVVACVLSHECGKPVKGLA
jgi:hypothetical protein